jgi:hypothetical protein
MPRDEQLKFINTCDCYVTTGEHLFLPELIFLQKQIIGTDTAGCLSLSDLRYLMRSKYSERKTSKTTNHTKTVMSTACFLNEILGENLL